MMANEPKSIVYIGKKGKESKANSTNSIEAKMVLNTHALLSVDEAELRRGHPLWYGLLPSINTLFF